MNESRGAGALGIGVVATFAVLVLLGARDALAHDAVVVADVAIAVIAGLLAAVGYWWLRPSPRLFRLPTAASTYGDVGSSHIDPAVRVPRQSGGVDGFTGFTDRARKVLTIAQDEAQRFDHNYIGTEHILLGLVREGDGVAARVLTNLNVELAKVRAAVEFIIGRGDHPYARELGLTPRAKRTIELAIDESHRLGHSYVGTEHLLLGLVREGEGIAAGVLESLGVELDKVRHEVIRVLSQRPDAAGEDE